VAEATLSQRTATLVSWSMWAASFVLLALGVVFSALTRKTPDPNAFGVTFDALLSLALLAFPTVGAIVTSRRPGNAIGWLFCVVGVSFGVSSAAYGWAFYGLFARPGSLPGAEVAAWVSSWVFMPALFSIPAYLFLLFPDGRPPSRRWRPVGWLVGVGLLATAAANALSPGRLKEPPFTTVENPVAVASDAMLDRILVFGYWLTLASILVAGVSLVVRFHRAAQTERQQLKWFASASVLFAFVSVLYSAYFTQVAEQAGQISVLFAFATIPVSVGIAILRHRLYDIDLLINRTLVYAALTATLVLVYVGSVFSLQYALRTLTGGDSQIAVVASTLLIAALFNPLRRRIQGVVDRRFYRQKYDARETLQAFGSRLRDRTDLGVLTSDLVSVVHDNLQPEHASIWLSGQKDSDLMKNPPS
jgi:hypothetical protein